MTDQIFHNYLGQFTIKLNPAIDMEQHVLQQGIWEADSVLIMERAIRSGQTCVDVGANVGFHTLTLAKAAGAPLLGQLPIDPDLSRLCDKGNIEHYNNESVAGLGKALVSVLENKAG